MERTKLEDGGGYKNMKYVLVFLLGAIICHFITSIYSTKKYFSSQRKFTQYTYRLKLKWYRFKYKIRR